MHLVPANQAHRRIIDEEKACQAIAAIADHEAIRTWSQRFSLLGDPNRLRLLLAIQAAGPISVSDMAVATGLTEDHVSQTLRFLRASQTVTAMRDGRVIRYSLDDRSIDDLLSRIAD
jgi:ArsR family transcriptional regulator, lead/cadmium/zinc/bismuth-responsive transcriptional repressor